MKINKSFPSDTFTSKGSVTLTTSKANLEEVFNSELQELEGLSSG